MPYPVVSVMDPMPETPAPRAPIAPQRLERLLLAVAAVLAAFALLPLSIPLILPMSAASMLVATASLWIATLQDRPWRRYAVWTGTAVLLLLGLLAFGGYMPPAWMERQTGLGVVLLGLLLPLSRAYHGAPRLAADLLFLVFGIFVLVMLMGGLFAFGNAFGQVSAIEVAPFSLLCFLLFAAVMVVRRSGGGLLAVLRGAGIGSRIVRIAVPLALVLPPLLTLLRAYVVSSGLLAPAYASAASVSFICLCVTLLALLMGWRINGLENEVRALMQRQSDEKLAESQQRYMQLVEQSISGFVVRGPDGRLLLVNEAYRRMTGYTREELLQLAAKDLVVDQGVLERVRKLQPGESAHIETFLRRKGGSLLEVEYVTQRLRDGNLQSVLLDISHRKQLQKQRDESERRYAELVEQAQEGISVRRPTGEFVFVNDTFCTMLGYSRDELLKLSIQDIVHPEDTETVTRVQRLGHGAHLRLQKRMLRKDGGVLHVEVSARRLRGGDVQSTVQDVTERHTAEHRYETAVNSLAEGVAVLDREGRVIAFNKSAVKILAMTEDQFTGRMVQDPDWQLQREDGTPFPMEEHPVIITLNTGQDRDDVILVAALPDGSRRTLTVSSRGLDPDRDGRPTSVLASFRDITQQRQHEQRLRDYAEELRRVSQRILEAQESERRGIAQDLHDEVGQALTATRINLKDLQQQAGDGPLAPRLAEAEAVVAELLGKVRQMSLDLHPSVLDDLGLVPALRWCVRTRTVGSELKVSLELPEELPRFEGMAEITLFRVFQETLSNVLKHSRASRLEVRLEYAGGRLLMSARDDGTGFDAAAARQRALSGESLGLLGMQERARLAGGELVLESAPGKGALVRVSLPANAR